jgi:hypothetical protein
MEPGGETIGLSNFSDLDGQECVGLLLTNSLLLMKPVGSLQPMNPTLRKMNPANTLTSHLFELF